MLGKKTAVCAVIILAELSLVGNVMGFRVIMGAEGFQAVRLMGFRIQQAAKQLDD